MRADIVVVLIEVSGQGWLLQLRDNKSTISDPNMWALFGGHVELGEDVKFAAVRELREELLLSLPTQRLTYVRSFQLESGKQHHLFHCMINDEVESLELKEGQAIGLFSEDETRLVTIDNKRVSPTHSEIIGWWFSRQQNRLASSRFANDRSPKADVP